MLKSEIKYLKAMQKQCGTYETARHLARQGFDIQIVLQLLARKG